MEDLQKHKLFYGWVIVAGCVMLSSASGIITAVMSVFIKPVSEALGVSRSAFTLTSTLTNLAPILLMPIVPQLFKRLPFKPLLLAGSLAGGAALLAFSFAGRLWQFYAIAVLGGTAVCFMNAVPIVILTSNWFVEKRGVATSISFSGIGLSATVLSPIVASVIEKTGWQDGYRLLAAAFWCLSVPAVLFLIREKPGSMGLRALGAGHAGDGNAALGFTMGQTLCTKSFLLFAAAMCLVPLASFGVQQHLVSFWSDIGLSAEKASAWFAFLMAVGIISKAALGAVYDKIGMKKATGAVCGLLFLSLLLLCFSRFTPALALSAALFGLGSGIQIVPPTYMTNKLFGDRDYSANYGIITTIYYCGMAAGGQLSAAVFDLTGSYIPAWVLYASMSAGVYLLLSAAMKTAKKERMEILGEEVVFT